MNVAQAISHALVKEGVRVAAGITGQSIGHLADALSLAPEVTLFYTRQERAAVDICDGYARVSGLPGVVFTDAGPAAANALGGLVNSWGDSTPLLFIAGHNDRFDTMRRQVKEIPFTELFAPVCKWTTVIQDASQVASIIRRAFMQLRTGRSGPVVIGMPYDLSSMPVGDFDYQPVSARPAVRSAADPSSVEAAVGMLAAAERPYVYVGAGVLASGATAELVELAELLTLPVATTLNGKSAFPENHRLALGIGGFARAVYSSLPATVLADKADVVLTIGAGFKKFATMAPMPASARHIQVDIDGAELNKEHLADIALMGDAKLVLRQFIDTAKRLLPKARLAPMAARQDEVGVLGSRWKEISAPLLTSDEVPINPFRVTAELTQLTDPDNTIVLHDAGSVRGTTCQHYIATQPRGFLGFGVQSAMGWSIGAAIGAKQAAPGKLVVAVIGEEAFGETAIDLETATRTGAAILVLVKNNRSDPARDAGVSPKLASTRFAGGGVDPVAVAEALGAKAVRIEQPGELREKLQWAIDQVKAGSTVVVEVLTRRVAASLHSRWEGETKRKPGEIAR
jgi:thiamine pyrophosphate-dependent acetolactate synthase large subunit-like protein